MRAIIAAIALCAGLAGCISTQTMPVSTNQVRIDTSASGLLWAGQAVPATMRAAANATLQAGYTHFKLSDVNGGVGSREVGATCSGGNGSATCVGLSAPTAGNGATVTMFHADEPGARGAFDARQVLVQYQ
jgi:hypothetical protein